MIWKDKLSVQTWCGHQKPPPPPPQGGIGLTFSQTSRNRECSLAWHIKLAKLASCPWKTNRWLLTTQFQRSCVILTVPINSSSKLARTKPSQPFMISSGTSKLPKFGNKTSLLLFFFAKLPPSEEHPAAQKLRRNMASSVTWSAIIAHKKCMSYPVPKVLSVEK